MLMFLFLDNEYQLLFNFFFFFPLFLKIKLVEVFVVDIYCRANFLGAETFENIGNLTWYQSPVVSKVLGLNVGTPNCKI